ncbi:MAG: HAD-IA family hydrolase [Candidatus Verstraetearchaeota archaeon]|nr:HAD-IA family hydrolase [Candidatus Verstraetearchaeota archaeon]
MSDIKAVLFDMDNTLMDFVYAQVGACRAVAALLGRGNGLDLLDLFIRSHGEYESYSVIADYMASIGAYGFDLYFECCEVYDRTKLDLIRPYEGVEPMLRSLRNMGVKTALVTNARRVNTAIRLERTRLREYFDVVVTADDTERVKPDPRHLEVALSLLKVGPEEALFVGDSIQRDVKAAKRIGIKAAYAHYGDCNFFEVRDERPDYLLCKPMDLIRVLEGTVGELDLQSGFADALPLLNPITPDFQTQRRS